MQISNIFPNFALSKIKYKRTMEKRNIHAICIMVVFLFTIFSHYLGDKWLITIMVDIFIYYMLYDVISEKIGQK